jgi:hypothetical protein
VILFFVLILLLTHWIRREADREDAAGPPS